MITTPTSHFIDASEVQPLMMIRHHQTHGGAGDYEVISVKEVFGGATSIQIKAVSDGGIEFKHSVLYFAGKTVEVVVR